MLLQFLLGLINLSNVKSIIISAFISVLLVITLFVVAGKVMEELIIPIFAILTIVISLLLIWLTRVACKKGEET